MIALPVRYTDKFYRELIAKAPEEYLKFAFWNGFAVGSVCSRLESQEEEGSNKIYIMTIGVIPAYRRRGIGEQFCLLDDGMYLSTLLQLTEILILNI